MRLRTRGVGGGGRPLRDGVEGLVHPTGDVRTLTAHFGG